MRKVYTTKIPTLFPMKIYDALKENMKSINSDFAYLIEYFNLLGYLIIRAKLIAKKIVFFQDRVIFRCSEKPFATCNCHYPLAAFLYCPGALHNATFSRNLFRNDFSFKYWRIRFDLK